MLISVLKERFEPGQKEMGREMGKFRSCSAEQECESALSWDGEWLWVLPKEKQSWSWAGILKVLVYCCFLHSCSEGCSNPEVFLFLV